MPAVDAVQRPLSHPPPAAVAPYVPVLLLVSAGLVGFAIDDRGAQYSNASFAMVMLAAVCIAVALFAPRVALPTTLRAGRLAGVGAAAAAGAGAVVVVALIGLQVASIVHRSDPLNLGLDAPFAKVPTARLLGLVVLVGAAGLVRQRSLRVVLLGLAAAAVLVTGSWVMRAPQPRLDVFMFERVSAHTLLQGHDPYDAHAVRFRDIYGGHDYAPTLTDGSVLKFGYPYPPLSLALITASDRWWHDPRRVEFACIAASVVLMLLFVRRRERWRSASVAAAAAVVMVTSPRAWYLIRSGYIEPLVVLLLALTVYCACRWRPGLPFALGALVVSKQYAPLLLPLAALLVPWRAMLRRSFLTPFLATAAVCTVPALVARGFWRSVVEVQFAQPFRRDSLSVAAWWVNHGHAVPSTALLFLPALGGLVVCCRYAPRTPTGFAASCAFVSLLFFAFAKQAFPNYYWLVIGALCIAAAASGSGAAAELIER